MNQGRAVRDAKSVVGTILVFENIQERGAYLENSERGGRISPPSPPPSPRPDHEGKLDFSGHAAYSIVGVFVMQSKFS